MARIGPLDSAATGAWGARLPIPLDQYGQDLSGRDCDCPWRVRSLHRPPSSHEAVAPGDGHILERAVRTGGEDAQSMISFAQHAGHDCSSESVLFEVDQELAKGSRAGLAQNSPMRAARSKSGSIRTCSSSRRRRLMARQRDYGPDVESPDRPCALARHARKKAAMTPRAAIA